MAENTQGFPPFGQAPGAAPAQPAPQAAPQAAPAAAPAAPQAAPAAPAAEGAKKERKKPNRQMTQEDINFVLSNVKTMSYSEMAEARGLTKHQVNRILMEVKKNLKAAAGEDKDKLAKVEAYIETNLSRPEDSRPGAGGGRGGAVKNTINDIVGNILQGL